MLKLLTETMEIISLLQLLEMIFFRIMKMSKLEQKWNLKQSNAYVGAFIAQNPQQM